MAIERRAHPGGGPWGHRRPNDMGAIDPRPTPHRSCRGQCGRAPVIRGCRAPVRTGVKAPDIAGAIGPHTVACRGDIDIGRTEGVGRHLDVTTLDDVDEQGRGKGTLQQQEIANGARRGPGREPRGNGLNQRATVGTGVSIALPDGSPPSSSRGAASRPSTASRSSTPRARWMPAIAARSG